MRLTRPSALRGTLAFSVSAAALAVAAVPAAAQAPSAGPVVPGAPTEVLPDLRQELPSQLSVVKSNTSRRKPRFQLGFRSSAFNVGPGVLAVHGHRGSTAQRDLTADQLVNMSDGTTAVRPGIGRLRFNTFSDHAHWHFLGFERYEIRTRSGKFVRKDRKSASGFCLGDRYLVGPEPQQPPRPAFDSDCGRGEPGVLSLYTGISVMWADDYAPHLEGQSIDVTGLKAGTYQLVHRVNPAKNLREARYDNNAASLRFKLRWPRGKNRAPKVTVTKKCAGAARCR